MTTQIFNVKKIDSRIRLEVHQALPKMFWDCFVKECLRTLQIWINWKISTTWCLSKTIIWQGYNGGLDKLLKFTKGEMELCILQKKISPLLETVHLFCFLKVFLRGQQSFSQLTDFADNDFKLEESYWNIFV